MKVMPVRGLILLASLALSCAPVFAQSSQQSDQKQQSQQNSNQPAAIPSTTAPAEVPLGDAARKAKQQKESQGPSSKAAPKTWNNDNIPKTGQINVIGAPTASADNQNPADQSTASAKTQNGQMSDQEKARTQNELADAQAKLEDLKKDADIAERRLKLDSDMYYGKPEYSNDTAGKAALDSETADVNNKKAAVAAKEKEIQDLQKKLGTPAMPSVSNPPGDNNSPANKNSISNNTQSPANGSGTGTTGISLNH
jgi:Spy/CpxP family protein refolding chaperone